MFQNKKYILMTASMGLESVWAKLHARSDADVQPKFRSEEELDKINWAKDEVKKAWQKVLKDMKGDIHSPQNNLSFHFDAFTKVINSYQPDAAASPEDPGRSIWTELRDSAYAVYKDYNADALFMNPATVTPGSEAEPGPYSSAESACQHGSALPMNINLSSSEKEQKCLASLSRKQKESDDAFNDWFNRQRSKVEGLKKDSERFVGPFNRVFRDLDDSAFGELIRDYQSLNPEAQRLIADKMKRVCGNKNAYGSKDPYRTIELQKLCRDEVPYNEGPKALIQDLKSISLNWLYVYNLNKLKESFEPLMKKPMDEAMRCNLTSALEELNGLHSTALHGCRPFEGKFYTKTEEIISEINQLLSCPFEIEEHCNCYHATRRISSYLPCSNTKYISESDLLHLKNKLKETIAHFERQASGDRITARSGFVKKVLWASEDILKVVPVQVVEELNRTSAGVLGKIQKKEFWSNDMYEDKDLDALLDLWDVVNE